MTTYTFVTFAPIQGFIEKTRKLRDLYGASLILSHLSSKLVEAIEREGKGKVISPGLPDYSKGMPNRILIEGEEFTEKMAQKALTDAWGEILDECREWLEKQIEQFQKKQKNDSELREEEWSRNSEYWPWKQEWNKWKNYSWEVFWGSGDSPDNARLDLETRKLSRRWTAINWIGESSSISGADAIAYPGMEGRDIKLTKEGFPKKEQEKADKFFRMLAVMLDIPKADWGDEKNPEVEGKFIDPNERLSIPELVKRLVTRPQVAKLIPMNAPESFREMIRQARNMERFAKSPYEGEEVSELEGHWTGWFMGDGDKMGDHLTAIAQKSDPEKIREFSEIIRKWGRNTSEFQNYNMPVIWLLVQNNNCMAGILLYKSKAFPRDKGRIVYAGGDDFMGVIYSTKPKEPIPGYSALEEIIKLHRSWDEMQREKLQPLIGKDEETGQQKSVTVSMGFVWVGPGVPQRDVLQHCREAEKESKKKGRNRITIRILFNNGQHLEWTTPWEYLDILYDYRDLDGGQNWSHAYRDLGQLRARHAFGFGTKNASSENFFEKGAVEFAEVYFKKYKERLSKNRKEIFKYVEESSRSRDVIRWIENTILIGWHLLGDRETLLFFPLLHLLQQFVIVFLGNFVF